MTAILNRLAEWKLPIANLRGQCYDGASNMSGARSGCKSIVMREAPKAMYVHCAAHRLNLAVVSGCKLQAFKSTEGTIGEIARFFHFSPKRQHFLEKAIMLINPSSETKKLKDACRTRWIERIDAYVIFCCCFHLYMLLCWALFHQVKILALNGTGTVKP